MRKVNYPFKTDYEKEIFLNKYFDEIYPEIPNQIKICKAVKKIDANWSLKKLLTADFNKLIEFFQETDSKSIELLNAYFKWQNSNKKKLYLYTDLQRRISDFLIKENVNIKSCFYCNIEYINNFKEEFSSLEDFINSSQWKQLENIIGKTKANKISKDRKKTFISENNIKNIFTNDEIKKIKIEIKNGINDEHFTLDHIIPKSSGAFLSISLFNLVPCCYSCNSKFKLLKEFKINNNLKNIIPSSKEYHFDSLIKFKLKITNSKIKEVEDVNINITNLSKLENVDEFIGIFKLQSRYNYHKNISYEMIQSRKIYSDSQIKEIARLLNRDQLSIKKDIFGKECFESNSEPFEKYKQDIAEQLGLI